jgi:molecular chaperone Hsp33
VLCLTAHADDLVQPFQIEASTLHGRLVRLGPTVDEILKRHDYPPPVARLLGECLAITVALASALKYDSVFSLQIKGDGPVKMLLADVTTDGGMRGYANVEGPVPDDDTVAAAPVPRLIGAGYVSFTVDAGDPSRQYQGMVELQGRTIADCIHHYFQQSQQFSAAVLVGADKITDGCWRAGALMVQRQPEDELSAKREAKEDAWRRALAFMATASSGDLLAPDLTPETLLFRLFHEDGVRVYKSRSLAFACRCSRERAASILAALPPSEVDDLTIDGEVVVTCQFCSSSQSFGEADLAALGEFQV